MVLAGRTFIRAARSGMQSFRSELRIPQVQEPAANQEAKPFVANVEHEDGFDKLAQALVDKAGASSVTVNLMRGRKNSVVIKNIQKISSTKTTDQKFDRSFNDAQEGSSSRNKYHEGHLLGASAVTLAIAEFAHYMAS